MADLSGMLYGSDSGGTLPQGEEYLRMLPKTTADLIRGYASGRMAISPRVAATSYGKNLLNAIYQYDPTFDVVNYGGRNKTFTDYSAGGSTGKKIASINTAMHHLQNLEKNYTKLDNFDFGTVGNTNYPNKIVNAVEQFVGVPRVQAGYSGAQKNIEDLSGELANAFRTGGGMAEADIKRELAALNPNLAPTEMRAKIQTIIQDLEGKIAENTNSYNRTMGTNKTTADFLSPEAKVIYDRYMAGGFGDVPKPAKKEDVKPKNAPVVKSIPLTASAIKAGVDQNTWNNMDEQQKKLFP
jgi:hypothetical protein